jgi:DpnD/PcfM-like protein
METFKIEIREVLSRVVEVEAISSDDAISKIEDLYRKTDVVLDYSDLALTDFIDISRQSKNDEKDELMKEVIEYLYYDEKNHFEESDEPENHIFKKLERLKSLFD